MKCPNCRQALIQKSEKGIKIRLDGPMQINQDGLTVAKCFWCKHEVELPLELKKSFVEERFIIKSASKP